jgi:hypothetical protein
MSGAASTRDFLGPEAGVIGGISSFSLIVILR